METAETEPLALKERNAKKRTSLPSSHISPNQTKRSKYSKDDDHFLHSRKNNALKNSETHQLTIFDVLEQIFLWLNSNELLQFCQVCKRSNELVKKYWNKLSQDLSRGKEKVKLICINEVDGEKIPHQLREYRSSCFPFEPYVLQSHLTETFYPPCSCLSCNQTPHSCPCIQQPRLSNTTTSLPEKNRLTAIALKSDQSQLQRDSEDSFEIDESKLEINSEVNQNELELNFEMNETKLEMDCNYDENHCLKYLKQEGVNVNEIPPIFECNSLCKCSKDCLNRVVQSGIFLPLQVRKTKEKGWSLVCGSDIKCGQFVCEYVGEVIPTFEAKKRQVIYDKQGLNYIFIIKEFIKSKNMWLRTNIDATFQGNVARFINHSCKPNLIPCPVRVDSLIPRIGLFACRDIEAGSELTFDYGNNTEENQIGKFPCRCGSQNCRKFLPFNPEV